MDRLNYYIHLFLQSEYRLYFNLFIILYFYMLLYEIKTVYCMNEDPNIFEIPTPEETQAEYVQFLEKEVWQLDAKNSELQHYTHQLEKEIESLRAENKALTDRIDILEGKEGEQKDNTT